ncbi:DUF1275 domain-containing protein [Pseudoroseomonas oryzae]|uniref:DUF1275 domain-containing protein n=2 Tax=Teichococcus oryzae TaxID=1608942 RepID=A0A5B2TJ72_9PROT|nr:DUF1275 domain-containing protein [Pseudoroseomonas oryzae]
MAAARRRALLRAIRPVRRLVAAGRSEATDRQLARALAFVAGAVNAGGLLTVGQYTAHMSGVISSLAEHAVLGAWVLVGAGVAALFSFTAGAAASAMLINWARRHRGSSQYALPLLLEAALLALFGTAGLMLEGDPRFMAAAVPLLCLIMGLQNATITKVSGARMRTTHMTGVVTDIGIELGKLTYRNRGSAKAGYRVMADRAKLRLLASLLGVFLLGGVVGALGFTAFGFAAALPLAALLALLGSTPAVEAALVRKFRPPF